MNVYDFRPGRRLKNVDPQASGETLERLRTEHGTLTPAIVLEEAKSEDSPNHHAFTWDDTEAAKLHRINEARRLITSIRILNAPTGRPTTAYVSVRTPEKGRSYVPTVEAMSDEELSIRVLAEIRQFIEGIERRYAHFQEVKALLEPLKKAVG